MKKANNNNMRQKQPRDAQGHFAGKDKSRQKQPAANQKANRGEKSDQEVDLFIIDDICDCM